MLDGFLVGAADVEGSAGRNGVGAWIFWLLGCRLRDPPFFDGASASWVRCDGSCWFVGRGGGCFDGPESHAVFPRHRA